MITGYNTDIEHEGVVYHVQTEDKGLESPIVLSLVYTGGEILAAKRASYADLVAAGFQEAKLAERLKRQHRLICAAIHAGRIEELRQLSKGQTGRLVVEHAALMEQAVTQPPEAATVPAVETRPETGPLADPDLQVTAAPLDGVDSAAGGLGATQSKGRATGSLTMPDGSSPYTVYDARGRSRLGEVIDEPDGLRITLLGHDPHFSGGEEVELKAIVTRISNNVEEPLSGAAISIKILGTTFRPVLLSVKTDREGLMSASTRIPAFTSGRAAIVVKATASDLSTEARWVVHPGK